jgi:hypothetical protein
LGLVRFDAVWPSGLQSFDVENLPSVFDADPLPLAGHGHLHIQIFLEQPIVAGDLDLRFVLFSTKRVASPPIAITSLRAISPE